MLVMDDPVTWVRERSHMLFRKDAPTAFDLLSGLMSDVLVLGGGSCIIRHDAPWWIIGSDIDWLSGALPDDQLFHRVIADPRLGEHSMRSEIFLTAFASSVSTKLLQTKTCILGEEPPERVWEMCSGLRRAVVFAMP